jgi:uncharacterized protein (TIGR02466 family)
MKSECFFSTPIWYEDKPEFIEALNKASDAYILEAKERDKQILQHRSEFGFSHHSSSLIEDVNFENFHSYIGEKFYYFLDNQGFDLTKYQLFLEQSWVQEFPKNGGGHHSSHIHSNTHVNAFYFLKCSNRTSMPIFYDPRLGSRTTKLQLKDDQSISIGSELIHFKVQPGTLIIFPGYLEHEFTVDSGQDPFRFIHLCGTAVLKKMAKERKNA